MDIKHATGRLNETPETPESKEGIPGPAGGCLVAVPQGNETYVVKQNEIVGADLLSSLVVGSTGSNRYKLRVETSLDEASTVT